MTESPAIDRPAKRLMACLLVGLNTNTTVGCPAPITEQWRGRMIDVRPGDLVAEISTLYRLLSENDMGNDLWDGQFVRYLRTERRFFGAEPDDGYEEVHICANPDGTEFRWTNASLIAVPDSLHWVKP